MNTGYAFRMRPFTKHHFIVGDFIVVDSASPLRFDLNMRLKEDYDFTAQHLEVCPWAGVASPGGQLKTGQGRQPASPGRQTRPSKQAGLKQAGRVSASRQATPVLWPLQTYGVALRLNRLFVKAEHRTNPGGAVAGQHCRSSSGPGQPARGRGALLCQQGMAPAATSH